MHLTALNCTLKNGESGQFYMYVLPQFKQQKKIFSGFVLLFPWPAEPYGTRPLPATSSASHALILRLQLPRDTSAPSSAPPACSAPFASALLHSWLLLVLPGLSFRSFFSERLPRDKSVSSVPSSELAPAVALCLFSL